MDHSPGFLQLVEEVKKNVKELSIDELHIWQKTQRKFVLVDVREESEWSAGHLPQALHLSKGIIERDIELRIPDVQTPLVLYCGGGFRSALAVANVQKMGYQAVYSLQGGFRAWNDRGLPLIKPDTE
ncbi:MAG: rhodanese-like domain-containing protein [Oligoflexus sp.]|jgi:rhodanese-related sulfurtransferase